MTDDSHGTMEAAVAVALQCAADGAQEGRVDGADVAAVADVARVLAQSIRRMALMVPVAPERDLVSVVNRIAVEAAVLHASLARSMSGAGPTLRSVLSGHARSVADGLSGALRHVASCRTKPDLSVIGRAISACDAVASAPADNRAAVAAALDVQVASIADAFDELCMSLRSSEDDVGELADTFVKATLSGGEEDVADEDTVPWTSAERAVALPGGRAIVLVVLATVRRVHRFLQEAHREFGDADSVTWLESVLSAAVALAALVDEFVADLLPRQPGAAVLTNEIESIRQQFSDLHNLLIESGPFAAADVRESKGLTVKGAVFIRNALRKLTAACRGATQAADRLQYTTQSTS